MLHHFVIAAVNVVFPWSMCPIVPTFMCGFVRSNFCLPISLVSLSNSSKRSATRALNGIRTHDPVLTKNVLYRLSYEGLSLQGCALTGMYMNQSAAAPGGR